MPMDMHIIRLSNAFIAALLSPFSSMIAEGEGPVKASGEICLFNHSAIT